MTSAAPIVPRLLTRPQVARRLGVSYGWLQRHDAWLTAHGFPGPAIDASQKRLWDTNAIDAWLDARIPAHLRPTTVAAANDAAAGDEVDWAAELARRAEAIADGTR